MITAQRTQDLLNDGYHVFTQWLWNSTSDTGSIGHREYVTYMQKDGKIKVAH